MDEPAGPVARFNVVMFTDIKGSTAYYSVSGDVAGRRKVQHHDEVTYPLVAAHGLKPDEWERLLALVGRPPTFTERGRSTTKRSTTWSVISTLRSS